jgi:tetratricopeptide (TPR) repeat protein
MVLRGLVVFVMLLAPAAAPAKGPAVGDLRKVGKVHLPISCKKSVQPAFDRGLALLHSFFYDEARKLFSDVAKKDPQCAMAYWGVAMTWWHPLWAAPDENEIQAGFDAIEKAKELGGKNELEQAYIAALDAFYTEPADEKPAPATETCHGPSLGTHRARAIAYARAMEKVFTHRPEDVETASLYALGLIGSADPTDKTLQNQLKATAVLEKFFADQKLKQHPGLLHYLIHGYDYPPVAEKGLPAAKRYADVAPWVPHALHMPSHIFVRLGMWKETIASNLASADAAIEYGKQQHPDATGFETLHAYDYLEYAYLQTGQDAKAKALVDFAAKVTKTYPAIDFGATYALGAIPARYPLERRAWADAAALTVPTTPSFEKFPFGEAHLVFAKGLGAARSGKIAEAKASAARMEALIARMTDPRFAYFAKQAGPQAKAVLAWVAHAEGKKEEAEKLLRAAADQDDALGKHPVSPGSLVPLRELLGDLLLELKKPELALTEYQASAKLNPHRFNTLYGAAVAAKQANQKDLAKKYFGELVSLAVPDGEPRKEISEARSFISAK